MEENRGTGIKITGDVLVKLCERAVNFVQITNEDGEVRLCSWLKDGGVIGHLSQNSLDEIYHSEGAKLIRRMHACGDHSNCNPNTCPYVANGNVDEISIDIEEVPKYPESLYLAYENVCNYHCVMCDIPNCMARSDITERERKLKHIDAELRKVLPYVKHLSANGLGELFVSRHILKLLSEWEPVADVNEVSVTLETNGSLFDKEHWDQISNLGKYKLSVAITILSFENEIYQELSGTKQSVKKLIDNLKFVKTLREEGVINYLELATVYQNGNFRQLPDFAKRCVEEFGADYVRLRPFEPWKEAGMKEWFMDVRNVYHPNHKEFLEVMKNPIFTHPRVHDWGGGRESGLGPEPYAKTRKMFSYIERILDDSFEDNVISLIGEGEIVIYGMTVVGKALVSRLLGNHSIPFCLDKGMDGQSYMGVSIFSIDRLKEVRKDANVIVAVHWVEDTVKKMLMDAGFRNVIGISEIIRDVK